MAGWWRKPCSGACPSGPSCGRSPRCLLHWQRLSEINVSTCNDSISIPVRRCLHVLKGCTALVIATGARPSINLAGPLQVDAAGVQSQVQACRAVGLQRVVLVSSLCAGRWLHPLNLFGLILVWKRLGERWLERSGLDWTVIRPGGLSEDDGRAEAEGVVFTGADQQQSSSIPRRLVARVCLDALESPAASGRIIEITSSPDQPLRSLQQWLEASPVQAGST